MSTRRVTSYVEADVVDILKSSWPHPVCNVAWIGSGHWSDCFGFQSTNRDLVVRVGRHVEDFRKDDVAARFGHDSLPIPRVLAVGSVNPDEHGDLYFAISERVFGKPLEEQQDWNPIVEPLADMLEKLRDVDISTLSGWGRWTPERKAPAPDWRTFLLQVNQDDSDNRVHGWSKKLRALPTGAADFERGYAALQETIVDDVPRSLVHNDLFNKNAFAANGVVTGIFDWGNSVTGDHLYDLALLCFWQPWLPRTHVPALLASLQQRWSAPGREVPDFERRLRACLLHIGLEHLGYHAYIGNPGEVAAVGKRMREVTQRHWLVT